MVRGTCYDNQEKYQQLFFHNPAVMIIFNSNTGDIEDIIEAAMDFYGYSADEFRTRKIFSINIAEQAVVSGCVRDIVMSGKKTFLFKHRLKSGEIHDVKVFSGAVNSKGKTLINSVIIDVTDKLRTERELRENRERLALVVAGTGAGIWDYDFVNQSVYVERQ